MNSKFLHAGERVALLTGGNKTIFAQNPVATYSGDSIEEFKKFAKKHKNKILIGYLAFDLAYQLYDIKKTAKDDLNLPKIYFQAFSEFSSKTPRKVTTSKRAKKFKPTLPKSQYNIAYKKIQDYIREGDIYQVNLTHRLEAKTDIPARELFLRTLAENPVEFAAYLEGPDFEIISASPERFIKIKDGIIETCPVKGTRPRGKTTKEDEKFKKELIESEKEAAELNMITDLLRNDLGKVCKVGSVKVEGHRLLSKCPTVWHTFSRITGKIKTTAIDTLISMLPGGSITGCPKKRAIEIIDELEPATRSVYTGVIGYIQGDDLDFNIAIRTIIKKGKKLYLQVGGGIVLDSTRKSEFEETLHKAASFTNIL